MHDVEADGFPAEALVFVPSDDAARLALLLALSRLGLTYRVHDDAPVIEER